MHDGDGTIGHGLTIDIEKGLSIRESTCYACIAHLDTKASEQEEGKRSLIDRCLQNVPSFLLVKLVRAFNTIVLQSEPSARRRV